MSTFELGKFEKNEEPHVNLEEETQERDMLVSEAHDQAVKNNEHETWAAAVRTAAGLDDQQLEALVKKTEEEFMTTPLNIEPGDHDKPIAMLKSYSLGIQHRALSDALKERKRQKEADSISQGIKDQM